MVPISKIHLPVTSVCQASADAEAQAETHSADVPEEPAVDAEAQAETHSADVFEEPAVNAEAQAETHSADVLEEPAVDAEEQSDSACEETLPEFEDVARRPCVNGGGGVRGRSRFALLWQRCSFF